MTDLAMFVAPKSDQMNADDLIAGPITITVTKVTGAAGEQPISIFYEGDNNKPFKPCKSMRRVLIAVWGRDGNQYTGRSMTLFRDPKVTYGGVETGGIRISHMSHIDSAQTVVLTATKQSRKPYTVKPLASAAPVATDKQRQGVDTMLANLRACTSMTDANALVNSAAVLTWREKLAKSRPELEAEIAKECAATFARLMPPPDEDDDDSPARSPATTPR